MKFAVVKTEPAKTIPAKVRLVATIPPALREGLENLQRRLRKGTRWKGRNATSISALVTKALQEYLHANG